MKGPQFKRLLKQFFKWFAAIAFIICYFYLGSKFGKKAQDTFSVFAGGLGMFIFGMNLMSSSLQRIAGDKLKNIISTLTKNPFLAMITGAFVTAVIQSSSATTVMTVGFVNAGLMNLSQAIGIILGANIGTTITAQLIAFKLTDIAWPILALGSALVMFSKTRRNRSWGETMIGFALLFLGMKFMGGSLKAYREHEVFKQTFIYLSQNRLLGVFAGLLVTFIVQSSSATVGLTMSLIGTGAFGDDPKLALMAAVPIILGDNIGTCITAMLSSIGATDNAKRTALAHTLFNILGTVLVLPFLDSFTTLMLQSSPDPMRQVANSHTAFNVVNGLIFLPLTGFLKKMVLIIIPPSEDEESSHAKSLDKRILATPPIAIGQTEDYFSKTSELIQNMFSGAERLLEKKDQDVDELNKLESKFASNSKQLAQQSRELNKFLVALAQKDLTEQQSKQVTRMLYLTKDLEILCYQLIKLSSILCEQFEESFRFSEDAREELFICFSRVRELFEQANSNINVSDDEAEKIKHAIYSSSILDKAARNNHLDRIKQGKQDPMAGIAFLDALRTIGNMLSSIDHFTEHKLFKF